MPAGRSRVLVGALTCIGAALAVGCSGDAVQNTDTPAPPKLLDNLGSQVHPIETSSPLAQRYFDQAMILTFGFNHEAAVRSFDEAARLDPMCAMCRWGVALALGPNINAPMGPEAGRRAYREVQAAMSLREHASPRERAYIEALATRYTEEPPEDRSRLDLTYANAMRAVWISIATH